MNLLKLNFNLNLVLELKMSSRSERINKPCGKPSCFVCTGVSPADHPTPRVPPPLVIAREFGEVALELLSFCLHQWPTDEELKRLGRGASSLKKLPDAERAERWSALATRFRNYFWKEEYGMVLARDAYLFSMPTIHLFAATFAHDKWARAEPEVKERIWVLLTKLVLLARRHTPPSSRREAEWPCLWDKAVEFARSAIPRNWETSTQSEAWEAAALKKAQAVYLIYVRKAQRPEGHVHFRLM